VLDLKARLLSMNAEDAKRLGSSVSLLLPKPPGRPLEKRDSECCHRAVMKARRGETARFQGLCPTVSGTPKWWDVIGHPGARCQGKPCHFWPCCATSRGRAAQYKFRSFRASANAHLIFDENGDYRFTNRPAWNCCARAARKS